MVDNNDLGDIVEKWKLTKLYDDIEDAWDLFIVVRVRLSI